MDLGTIFSVTQTASPVVTLVAVLLLWRLDATIKELQLTIAKEYASLRALDNVSGRVTFLEQQNMKP